MTRHLALTLALLGAACDAPAPPTDAGSDAAAPPEPVARFDLSGEPRSQATFFDLPFPSDLRLTERGTPDLTGYPNPRVAAIDSLLPVAEDRPGWPVVPVGYFRFEAPVRALSAADLVPAAPTSPILLVDVDPSSPDRGRLVPTVATTFPPDRYTGENLVGVAAYPGVVLHPERTYAFVILRALGDAGGEPLRVPAALARLARGEAPNAALGARALALYAPMFETLDAIGVAREEVAAATVFTTGDVVAALEQLSTRVVAAHDVTIDDLRVDPRDGATNPRLCELIGTVTLPQFQRGTPPFDTEGRLEIGAGGLPVVQREETVPITLTIPNVEMPEAGYPLMVYFHGSGGVAAQVIDRGPRPPGGAEAVGRGPAYMIAEHGFAAVGAALPLSPDRLPGASAIEYINFDNLGAFPGTFTQGVLEQRLLIEALRELAIDPSALAGCAGPSLPDGASAYRFDASAFVGLGQSMGGMYTNMVGAVEPALSALVPTGAGGFWSYFILETQLIPDVRMLLGTYLRADGATLTHLHPSLHLLELAWEPAEPLVFVPRIARRPLPGFTPRPIYEPAGEGDSYFPPVVYDAMALAYGHPQAGEVVWSSMQASLALAGLDGVIDYPVAQNLASEAGEPYTGVVVQYAGDGFSDPHNIFTQLEAVRYQWGCFLATQVATGTAVVPAPATEGTPCPTAP